MQRCLVHWVSSAKKPSGFPADRGIAWRVVWRDMRVRYPRTRGRGRGTRGNEGGREEKEVCVCPRLGQLSSALSANNRGRLGYIAWWIVAFCASKRTCAISLGTSRCRACSSHVASSHAPQRCTWILACSLARVLDLGSINVSYIRRRSRKQRESSKTDDKQRRRRRRLNNAIECAVT